MHAKMHRKHATTVEKPATTRKVAAPVIGFIAHVDTSPEMSGAGVKPIVHAAWDGGDIVLVAVHGNSADVRLTGLCAECPSAQMTLHLGVEAVLREDMAEFETLRVC